MKNYLVQSLHKINSTWWGPDLKDRNWEGDIYGNYKKMQDISRKSFEKFLVGDWEYIFIEGEVKDFNELYKKQFFDIRELWEKEPCNIFYSGTDTQVIAPLEIFGKYKEFRLFNYTDPKQYQDISHFLNADVRYYPAEMPDEIWNIGLDHFDKIKEWNDDQIIYNRMVWSQGLTPEQVIDPTMAFQGFMLPDRPIEAAVEWNNCDIAQVKLIHWHGSRGSNKKLSLMENLEKQLDS